MKKTSSFIAVICVVALASLLLAEKTVLSVSGAREVVRELAVSRSIWLIPRVKHLMPFFAEYRRAENW